MSRFLIPMGYRFNPTDEELICYLYCKANGEPLPYDGDIQEVDLYHMNDPGKLFRTMEEDSVYVFTKLKKVSQNGRRIDRKVTGNRSWNGVDKGKPIRAKEDGRLIGEKKNFNLINNLKIKLGYSMAEYVLDKEILITDYVLCHIKKQVKRGRWTKEDDTETEIQTLKPNTVDPDEGSITDGQVDTTEISNSQLMDFELALDWIESILFEID